MRVLMVASGNNKIGHEVSSFVYEQTLALRKQGIEVEIFPIVGRGISGYLKAALKLNRRLKEKKFDLVHGHYITAALVTIFQFKVPVVVSFIGCDINVPKLRRLSKFTLFPRASAVIFVTEKLQKISGYRKRSFIIPYGIDVNAFFPVDKLVARKHLQWNEDDLYIFFASRFNRPEKNAQLAFDAVERLKQEGTNCHLVEFRNIKGEDLNYYYNACDLLLLTSTREGSPNVIKEAMVCNKPFVSTDVGDVRWVAGNTEGCFITDFSIEGVAAGIRAGLEFSGKNGPTRGRERILDLGLDATNSANKIIEVYTQVMNAKH